MRRGRRALIVAVSALLLGLLGLRALSRGLTDLWWARSVGAGTVWTSLFGIRAGLVLACLVASGGLTWASVWLAGRISEADPERSSGALPFPVIAGLRTWVIPASAATIVAALLAPVGASWWDQWLRFRHGAGFPSQPRPMGRSLDFYVFQLPFLRSVSAWTTALLVMVLLVTLVAYELLGGARLMLPPRRLSGPVQAHLLALVAMTALSRAVATWWERYALAFSANGFVRGLGAVDRSVRSPAMLVLALLAFAVAVVAVVEIRRGGVRLTSSMVVVWVVAAVLGDVVVPRLVQSWRVNADRQEQEAPSIAASIAATRASFGIDVEPVPVTGSVPTAADVARSRIDLDLPIVWEPGSESALTTVNKRQAQLEQFVVPSIDLGMYDVGAGPEPLIVGVRERSGEWLASQQWQTRTRVVTHGVGVVAARAGTATSAGDPDFVRSGLAPVGALKVREERVYFGEEGAAVVVGGSDETDLTSRAAERTPYDGRDGLRLESGFRRLMFAIRLGDANLIAPGFDTTGARLLLHREVRRRAASVAPFLRFDSDPYPVIADGRVIWVLDGYTTSSTYPNAARVDLGAAGVRRRAFGIDDTTSYLRSPVRVTVDAFDGTVRLYLVDPTDPVARTYRRAFPDLFRAGDELPPGVVAQLRYPLDQLRIQAQLAGRFHTTDVASFFEGSRSWQIAPAPATTLEQAPTADPVQAAPGARTVGPVRPVPAPAPIVLRRPDGLLRLGYQVAMVRSGGEQLRATLLGVSDGLRTSLRLSEIEADIDGPVLAARNMDSDRVVRREQTAAGQTGSRVLLGSLQVLPVGDGVLYLRPMFVTSSTGSARSELSLLKQVIISDPAGRVVVAPTYRSALARYLGRESSSGEGAVADAGEPTVGELLARADDALTAADQSLRQGDLGEYQRRVGEVADLVRRARSTADRAPAPTPRTASGGPVSTLP
jgi:hypothetical protein